MYYLGGGLKIQRKQQYILLVFITIASIFVQAVFGSADSLKENLSPIGNTNFSNVNDAAALINKKINLLFCQEVKIVANETAKIKKQISLERKKVRLAKKDLAHRLSIKVDQINLLEVRQVQWPDSSLGCPQPGKVYKQLPQDGLLIRLEVAGQMYFYHSGGTQAPFFCEQTSQVIPYPIGGDEFVPPPGSEID